MEKDATGTMITGKPETVIDRKRVLFRSLVPLINKKIGKEIDSYEEEAVAFVVEELFQEPTTAESFLKTAFGVGEEEGGRDVAMAVHNAVYEAKMKKINRRIEDSPSDAKRLELNKLIRENIEIGHNQTLQNYRKPDAKVYIGGVPEEWIPSWLNSSNASLGQEQ